MSVVDGWSDCDVAALTRLMTEARSRLGLSRDLLEDLRQVVGVDQVLLLEREAELARLTAAAPYLELVDSSRALPPEMWSSLWDCGHCPLIGTDADPFDTCVTDHLHRPRIDSRLHRDLAGSHVVMAALASPTGEARLVFVRRMRAFDERDRAILALLRPHLVTAYRRCAERRGGADTLTPRQRAVLHLVARGCSNEEIASHLVLSPGTVRKHLDNAFRQLGVSSRAAAVARAFPEGVPPYPLELRAAPLMSLPRQRAN